MSNVLKYAPALLLAIICLSLYLPTMARTIYTEDSSEFITAAHTLSVPHPSGYPTYLMTTKVLSYLPFFPTLVERMHFVSTLWTIAAVLLFYFVGIRLFKNRLIAFSLSLLFATVPMVWLQATYAEVYSLNTFFIVLLLWLYLWYDAQPNTKKLYLLFFVYGLSVTNHFLPFALGPLFLGFLLTRFAIKKNWFVYLKLFGIWVLGLLPYAYIPIRTRMNPPFVWFGGDTTDIVVYNFAYFYKASTESLLFFIDVFTQYFTSYGWITFFFFLTGIVWMLYNHYEKSYGILGALFLFSLGIIIAVTNGRDYTLFAGWFYQTLYAPFLLVSLIPVGYLLKQLYEHKLRIILFYTTLLAILIWPATQIGDRFLLNNRSEYVFLNNYTDNLLANLPPQATLYTHSDVIVIDPIIYSLGYKQYVERARPDIKIYSLSPVFPNPPGFKYGEQSAQPNSYLADVKNHIATQQLLDEQVYTTFPWDDNRLTSIGYGAVHRITHDAEPQAFIPYVADNLHLPATEGNFFNDVLFAKYYYDLAAWAYSKGAIKSGQWFMVQAISYDPDHLSQLYQETVAFRTKILTN